jgi:hypothetical protein
MARKSTQIQKAVSICFRGWFSCYKRKGHCACWDLTSVLCIKTVRPSDMQDWYSWMLWPGQGPGHLTWGQVLSATTWFVTHSLINLWLDLGRVHTGFLFRAFSSNTVWVVHTERRCNMVTASWPGQGREDRGRIGKKYR